MLNDVPRKNVASVCFQRNLLETNNNDLVVRVNFFWYLFFTVCEGWPCVSCDKFARQDTCNRANKSSPGCFSV